MFLIRSICYFKAHFEFLLLFICLNCWKYSTILMLVVYEYCDSERYHFLCSN